VETVLASRSRRPGGEIASFDIDASFVDRVRRSAVEQADADLYPGRPQIADPTKTDSSLGLAALDSGAFDIDIDRLTDWFNGETETS